MRKTNFKNIRLVLSIFIMGLILSSCSGGGGDDEAMGNNYFQFKMNGVLTDYSQHKDTRATLTFVKSRNKHVTFSVTGYDKNKPDTSPGPALSIRIDAAITDLTGQWIGIDITTGTYTGAYHDGYSLGCNHYVTGTDNYVIKDENFILKIDVLTKTHAKGTFSGILEDHNGQQMIITDGVFSVGVKYTETDN